MFFAFYLKKNAKKFGHYKLLYYLCGAYSKFPPIFLQNTFPKQSHLRLCYVPVSRFYYFPK